MLCAINVLNLAKGQKITNVPVAFVTRKEKRTFAIGHDQLDLFSSKTKNVFICTIFINR